MPFLYGSRPDRGPTTHPNGYVIVHMILEHEAVQSANIAFSDIVLLDLARCEEQINGQYLRNIKFSDGQMLIIIYDGIS